MVIKKFYYILFCLSLLLLSSCQTNRTQSTGEVSEAHTEATQVDVVEKPEFLQKEAPKLGVILGGGGALSYAHIGFLQELESQKIPIHALVGMEWGALVAGAYAKNNKAHAVEWKLLKVPYKQFTSSSFFSSGKEAVAVSKFKTFLNDIFGNDKFSDLELAYGCTYTNVTREKTGVQSRGHVKNALKSCWPYPPHFTTGSVAANPVGLAVASKFLRQQGAEVILYVDVLSGNRLLTKKNKKNNPNLALLWVQNKSSLNTVRKPMVDEVIKIALPGFQMDSYKSLRSIVRMGQVKTKSQVKGFAKKYAY